MRHFWARMKPVTWVVLLVSVGTSTAVMADSPACRVLVTSTVVNSSKAVRRKAHHYSEETKKRWADWLVGWQKKHPGKTYHPPVHHEYVQSEADKKFVQDFALLCVRGDVDTFDQPLTGELIPEEVLPPLSDVPYGPLDLTNVGPPPPTETTEGPPEEDEGGGWGGGFPYIPIFGGGGRRHHHHHHHEYPPPPVSTVPEPTSLVLVLTGLGGIALRRKSWKT